MPGGIVILFTLLIVMSLLTYVIPAGQYQRIESPTSGRMMVDPNSFTYIDKNPTSFLKFLIAIPRGFTESAAVIAFTFIIAGAIEVVKRTGLINTIVVRLSKKFENNASMVIPILMIVFSLLAAFVGTPELSMIYVPIIMPLLVSLGFNAITAVAIPLVGTVIGFTAAFTNPFTVGIAHEIAQLPMFSGLWFRVIVYLILMPIGTIYIMRYANSIKTDSKLAIEKALTDGSLANDEIKYVDNTEFSNRQKVVGLFFVVILIIMIYGVLTMNWGMIEMAGIFVGLGVLAGIIGGMNAESISGAFVDGAKNVMAGGILIGVARGVSVIMNDAMILDTIVHFFASMLNSLPGSLNAIGIFIMQTAFNFLVPSGSGKALVTMPIISPLAEIVGLNQQVAVLAFQFGDGLTNILWPTSGFFMATLQIAKVEWTDWAKFYTKLLIILSLLCAVILVIAQAINLGPF